LYPKPGEKFIVSHVSSRDGADETAPESSPQEQLTGANHVEDLETDTETPRHRRMNTTRLQTALDLVLAIWPVGTAARLWEHDDGKKALIPQQLGEADQETSGALRQVRRLTA
jgi:hypothetical protein